MTFALNVIDQSEWANCPTSFAQWWGWQRRWCHRRSYESPTTPQQQESKERAHNFDETSLAERYNASANASEVVSADIWCWPQAYRWYTQTDLSSILLILKNIALKRPFKKERITYEGILCQFVVVDVIFMFYNIWEGMQNNPGKWLASCCADVTRSSVSSTVNWWLCSLSSFNT